MWIITESGSSHIPITTPSDLCNTTTVTARWLSPSGKKWARQSEANPALGSHDYLSTKCPVTHLTDLGIEPLPQVCQSSAHIRIASIRIWLQTQRTGGVGLRGARPESAATGRVVCGPAVGLTGFALRRTANGLAVEAAAAAAVLADLQINRLVWKDDLCERGRFRSGLHVRLTRRWLRIRRVFCSDLTWKWKVTLPLSFS